MLLCCVYYFDVLNSHIEMSIAVVLIVVTPSINVKL